MDYIRLLSAAALLGCAWLNNAVAAPADGPQSGAVKFDYGADLLVAVGGPVINNGIAGQAPDAQKTPQFQQDLLVHGAADWSLGPDLTVGAYANIRVDEIRQGTPPEEPDNDDVVKAAYLHLKDAQYGDLQFGHEADVRVQQGYWAPQVCDCLDGFLGTNSPQVTLNASPAGNNSTTANIDGRAVKLAWYGPEIDGFTASLSFAPEAARPYALNPRLGGIDQRHDAALDRFVSAALDWQGNVGPASVGIGAGLTSAARKSGSGTIAGRNDADPLLWDAGFLVSYAAWKFGGAYEQQNNINAAGIYGAAAFVLAPSNGQTFLPPASNGLVNRTFDIGFTYSIGPVTTGVAWSRGLYQGLADPSETRRVSVNDMVFAGAAYEWREGFKVILGLQDNNYDPAASSHALPVQAGLNRVFGGSNPGLNIWGQSYQAFDVIAGVSIRL